MTRAAHLARLKVQNEWAAQCNRARAMGHPELITANLPLALYSPLKLAPCIEHLRAALDASPAPVLGAGVSAERSESGTVAVQVGGGSGS
jgi:hypothetical protein